MYKFYSRIYQSILRLASYFLPWRKPVLFEGENSINKLSNVIKSNGVHKVLIVTGRTIPKLGLMDGLLNGLNNEEIKFQIYDRTVPNPTIDNIEEALRMYHDHNCDAIIAFGGGSPMDCAKGVAARVARPDKSIPQMKGLLKVRKKTPLLFAIPTTAGTGSEATIAAVISDSSTHEKYAINDMALIPHYAVLDPTLTVGLPPNITSTTGMDTLTHAIEAYIGRSNTNETKELSKMAVKLVFENIYKAYSNGTNLEVRENMQKASYYAGVAFTRAYVGYVHTIAHALGGLYEVPHGKTNAVVLPYVLAYYGDSAYSSLSELADLVSVGEPQDSSEQKSFKFIDSIKELNRKMNIPEKISGIKESDIPLLVERAFKEANPLYPVPKILTRQDLFNIFNMIKE